MNGLSCDFYYNVFFDCDLGVHVCRHCQCQDPEDWYGDERTGRTVLCCCTWDVTELVLALSQPETAA